MRMLFVMGVLVMLMGTTLSAQQTNLQYLWNLSDIYPTREAFDAARAQLAKRLVEIEANKGKLGQSAANLKATLDTLFALRMEFDQLGSYASMHSDEDTRVPENLGAAQEVRSLGTDFATHVAWITPEILVLPEGKIKSYLAADKGLAPYAFFLEDIERQRPHTLSPAEEKLLAQTGLLTGTPGTVYGIFANADMPFPEIKLASGEKVRLDQAGYTKYRALSNRADRVKVFHEFWQAFKAYERSFGVMLDANVKKDLFAAHTRNFPTCLQSSLFDANVPESVYHTLIAEANRSLPTLHRAFKIRAKLLGISDLAYHDIYPPLVAELDASFPIARGQALTLDALKPLGADYVATVQKGFNSRWMDVYPQPGKRSGAYSNGSLYQVHPFVLMNYNDDYESVSTLAHEWGHAMHSYLANHAQPYPMADYPIFMAEVASTFNEALLLDRMLKEAKSDDEKLILLGSYLENLRGTFFRQTMFAEFELASHTAAEKGEALTGAKLSAIYGDLLRRYHGHDQGVVKIDDLYNVEWAYIPHFYNSFYVFQYATSMVASTKLASDVLAGKPGANDRYLGLLRAGGSRYAYDLLKQAGVDLATPEPYRALDARMSWAMDEIEKIIARRETKKSK